MRPSLRFAFFSPLHRYRLLQKIRGGKCGENTYWSYDYDTRHLSITGTGDYAFDSQDALKSISIPNSVANIGENAFEGCVDLTEINVAADNAAYCSENGVLYDKEKTEIIRFPIEKSETSFTIPTGITSVANGAFGRCRNLTSIEIPDDVTNIGDYAFKDCGRFRVYYIGTPDEWSNITKGYYCSIDTKLVFPINGISAKRSAGGIVVKPVNIENGKTVVLALYDGDKLIEIKSVHTPVRKSHSKQTKTIHMQRLWSGTASATLRTNVPQKL